MNSMVILGGIRAYCVYDGGGCFGRANGGWGRFLLLFCYAGCTRVPPARNGLGFTEGVVAVKVQPRVSGVGLGSTTKVVWSVRLAA